MYYYPYGEIHTNNGADVTRYKFTGQEYDAETGLYYYNARYYDPKLARFITADTIVPDFTDPQTLNRYSYCTNNPINLIDPTGHFSFGKFLKSFISGIAGGAAFVLSGGNPVIAGIVAGVVSGAMTGKIENVFIGAVTGGILGGVGGAVYSTFGNVGAYSMLGAGAAYSVTTEGLDGLAYFAGGVMGGYIGATATPYVQNGVGGYGFKTNNDVIETLAKENRYQEAIDFASKRYYLSNGEWAPNDPAFANDPGLIAYTDMTTGQVKYGPLAFSEKSLLQATGYHEGVHVSQFESKQVIWDYSLPDPIVNRYSLEVNACRQTINNAWKLNLTKSVIQQQIDYYNYNAKMGGLPLW